MKFFLQTTLATLLLFALSEARFNEYIPTKDTRQHIITSLPHEQYNKSNLPEVWEWSNVNNTNFLTKSLNQHIPQYCGSCWAHGALSALSDRIKIARKAQGVDINLSIQYILNCGDAGSCYGGSHTATYQFIHKNGNVPFDTCQPYLACSFDSEVGLCSQGDWTCTPENICRTCSTFPEMGGKCLGLSKYPNASISEYGTVRGEDKMMAEIYARGPIACGINANAIENYQGGIFDNSEASTQIDHIVSITGWGKDAESGKKYWTIRNSWGEYWGELGYIRLVRGEDQLGIEEDCAWAVPSQWTELNYPCNEDGSNCKH